MKPVRSGAPDLGDAEPADVAHALVDQRFVRLKESVNGQALTLADRT